MPNVTVYLSKPEMDRLKTKADKRKMPPYRLAKSYIQKGLRDEDEQGRRTEEESDRPRQADTEPQGATGEEPEWKREYEEYRRRYGGR